MKKIVGYTCGVFDMLHEGHLILLERCKENCDYLIVGICNDEYVRIKKKTTPVYSEKERLRIIRSLRAVDEAHIVTIEETEDKIMALEKYKFNILFSGDDWKGSERYKKTEDAFIKCGAKIMYFPYTNGISTSGLKEKFGNGY